MARAGLLDVPCDEPGQARARRTLCIDLEPQLRGPPGPQGPHPPRLAHDGGGGGGRGTVRRCEDLAVSSAAHPRRFGEVVSELIARLEGLSQLWDKESWSGPCDKAKGRSIGSALRRETFWYFPNPGKTR